ncbi:galactokinase, partial [bacterium]
HSRNCRHTRREQCEAGVKIIQKYRPEVKSLRDIPLELLQEHKNEFDPVIYKRCEYVIKENMRLLSACNDLNNNDLVSFGQRISQSHIGLRDDYEVSCKELDILVDLADQEQSILGSRMMGGGFGGCTINLVKEEAIEEVGQKISKEYKARTGLDLTMYTGKIQNGTTLIEDN